MVNSTNYTNPSKSSTNFLGSPATSDVLLLEGGDKILLENGTDAISLEEAGPFSTAFTASSVNSTDYS